MNQSTIQSINRRVERRRERGHGKDDSGEATRERRLGKELLNIVVAESCDGGIKVAGSRVD